MNGTNDRKQTVYCLAVDLVSSTKMGFDLSSTKRDQRAKAFRDQIGPHLTALGLTDEVVKFEGDGWLIMTPDLPSQLGCLALIFRDCLRKEMAASSGLPFDKIPGVRIALCNGRDELIRTNQGRDYYSVICIGYTLGLKKGAEQRRICLQRRQVRLDSLLE